MLIKLNKEVECWLSVPGYIGFYEASNLGRVRSINRKVNANNGKIINRKGILLKPQPDKKGYLHVILNKSGERIIKNVHRIICEIYHNEKYFEGAWVNHINGNKSDNRVSNLEYTTPSENIKHAFVVLGKKLHMDSLKKPVIQYDRNLNFINRYDSIIEASKATKTHERGISGCLNGWRKTSNNFIWKLEK